MIEHISVEAMTPSRIGSPFGRCCCDCHSLTVFLCLSVSLASSQDHVFESSLCILRRCFTASHTHFVLVLCGLYLRSSFGGAGGTGGLGEQGEISCVLVNQIHCEANKERYVDEEEEEKEEKEGVLTCLALISVFALGALNRKNHQSERETERKRENSA